MAIKPNQSLEEMRDFIAERKAKIADIEAEIASFVTALHLELGLTNTTAIAEKNIKRSTKRIRIGGNSTKEEVAAAARTLIEARGKPIPRAVLYHALIDQGLKIQGKDPEMVLGTMLWRMKDHIVRLKTGGYWLAERPLPEGEYVNGQ